FSATLKEDDMFRFTRFSILLSITLLVVFIIANAQTPQRDSRPRTGSIGGRGTVGSPPAANALGGGAGAGPAPGGGGPASSNGESQPRAFIKVRTNGDGRYKVTGLTEGAYLIRALSKAYTLSKDLPNFAAFKSVTLDEGESRDDVDIALVRGGVITGRVTNAEGMPLILGRLQLLSMGEKGIPVWEGDYRLFQTDDRGVYRIYGLSAGRYILSAVFEGFRSSANHRFPQTFYPDVTDQKQAKVIEGQKRAEVTDIDIKLGAATNTYEAAGRVIDAETGQLLPTVGVMCAKAPGNENSGPYYRTGGQTDDEGKFRFIGLSSGRYELSLQDYRENGRHYSE